jgi:anti-sigma B factor antagonist
MYTKGRVIVMELPEQLNGAEGKTFLRNLQPLFEVNRPCLVLDCSQLQYMDSVGIEMLLHCMDEAMKRDGDLKLAALSPSSAAILELMRVDRLFEVFETAEEAARSFHAIASPENSASLPWYAGSYQLPNLNPLAKGSIRPPDSAVGAWKKALVQVACFGSTGSGLATVVPGANY